MEEDRNTSRGFKGIWIPKEIWLNENLTMQEKIFLVEIDSLDNDEGCTAGNQYFADFFGISKTRVSIVIQNLISKGYITSKLVYKEGSKQILYRVLNICRPPYPTFVIEGIQQKLKGGIQQKLKDNNTINNNTNNNIKKERKKPSKATSYDQIIDDMVTDSEIKELIYEFIKMRNLKKKPMTDRALKIQINKLHKLSSDINIQKQIIEKAIVKTWDEFYPLNDSKPITNSEYKKRDRQAEVDQLGL